MKALPVKIVANIGGTFARFGIAVDYAVERIRKYRAADYATFEAALEAYCAQEEIATPCALRIATAGYDDGGVWKFVNQNTWQIDPKALEAAGWTLEVIINDFEAAAYALPHLAEGAVEVVRPGAGAADTLCLIGPGTGLGLAYHHGGARNFVQKTHGGHMPAACVNAEQWDAAQAFRARQDKDVVFENIVSGPGLQTLYDLYDRQTALRLFHEFFGLFAATCVVAGHAYGGLYLTGGVLERLEEDGALDMAHFMRFFTPDVAASVKRDLSATPIIRVRDPYPALKGLLYAA